MDIRLYIYAQFNGSLIRISNGMNNFRYSTDIKNTLPNMEWANTVKYDTLVIKSHF